ncbi:MAG: hypothetical protein ABI413_16965 [Ktedonobacteraceae bacterium]
MMDLSISLDGLTDLIQMLQQLQQVLPLDATLADVADLLAEAPANTDEERMLASVEAVYNAECLLEDAIQALVGVHLAVQLQRRTARHMGVAA